MSNTLRNYKRKNSRAQENCTDVKRGLTFIHFGFEKSSKKTRISLADWVLLSSSCYDQEIAVSVYTNKSR